MKEVADRREGKDSMTRDVRKAKGKVKQRYLLTSEKKRQNLHFFTLKLLV